MVDVLTHSMLMWDCIIDASQIYKMKLAEIPEIVIPN